MFVFEEDSYLTFMVWNLHSKFLFTKQRNQNINNAEAPWGKSSDINLKLRPHEVKSSTNGACKCKIKIFALSGMPNRCHYLLVLYSWAGS